MRRALARRRSLHVGGMQVSRDRAQTVDLHRLLDGDDSVDVELLDVTLVNAGHPRKEFAALAVNNAGRHEVYTSSQPLALRWATTVAGFDLAGYRLLPCSVLISRGAGRATPSGELSFYLL